MDGMGVLWRKGVASVQEVGKDKAVNKISKVMGRRSNKERIRNITWYFAIMKKGEEAGDNKKGTGTRMKGYEKWEI